MFFVLDVMMLHSSHTLWLLSNKQDLLLLKENEEIIQSTLYLKHQQAEVQVVLGGHSYDPAFGYRKS